MAFKVVTKRRVWWPVTIRVPVDGGGSEEQTCEALFEIIDQAETDAINGGRTDNPDLLARVLLGLRQTKKKPADEDEPILDEQDRPLDGDAAKALFLGEPYIRVALYAGYVEAANGAGRRKNSR